MAETLKLIVKLDNEGWFSRRLKAHVLDVVCEKYGTEAVAEWLAKNAPEFYVDGPGGRVW